MDQLFVQEIDDILKQKLPRKSSVSGAEWVAVNPENTQDLLFSTASVIRFRLPRRGYLARSRGQTGPFFQFGVYAGEAADAEIYSAFRQYRLLVNGVEVENNQYYNHYYPEWLKSKPINWLQTDAGNFGLTASYAAAPFGAFAAANVSGITQATANYFTLPIPDNQGLLGSVNQALPLEYLDVVLEITLNNFANFMSKHGVNDKTSTASITGMQLMIPIVFVDPDVDDAIRAKLDMGDANEADMFLIPVQDVKVDAQSYSFASTGTKTFVWNSVSSMCRLLLAKISLDAADGTSYKTATGLTGGCSQYLYRVDGKNVTQSPIVLPYFGAANTNSANQAYPLYQDFVSALNQINNDTITMSPLTKSIVTSVLTADCGANPANGLALTSSFAMVANLDTVSKDLVGGQKLINNLTLDITNSAAGAQSNVYLMQFSNKVIGISRNRAKVIR